MSDRRAQDLTSLKRMKEICSEIDGLKLKIEHMEEEIDKYSVSDVKDEVFEVDNFDKVKAEMEAEKQRFVRSFKCNTACKKLAIAFLISGIAVFIFADPPISAYGGIAGIVIAVIFGILQSIINSNHSKQGDIELARIKDIYDKKSAEALDMDLAEGERFRLYKENKFASVRAEIKDIQSKIINLEKEYDNVSVISKEDIKADPDIVDKMIRLIESRRADSIKECFAILDEEKRRALAEAEAFRRAEEERIRNSPGTVHVMAVRRNTYDKKYEVVRNLIEIDGQDYGSAGLPYKSIQLMPGFHTIRVHTQSTSEVYSSNVIQFNLKGGEDIYYKFEKISIRVQCNEYYDITSFLDSIK